MNHADETESVSANLGFWDTVSIIVGIVVGVAIFKSPQVIFNNVNGPWQLMAVWVLGGLLVFVGALCYAELATTYPRSGGDYVYLTRAYGSWVGFLFGWGQLVVIMTGTGIGAMAFAFSDYSIALWNLDPSGNIVDRERAEFVASRVTETWGIGFAVGVVVFLSFVNLLGVVLGKTIQNILTVAKIVSVLGIIVVGLICDGSGSLQVVAKSDANFGVAMILVLYAYGGWNNVAYIAAEVRDPQRNIPKALLFGIGGITLIYLLVNAAYMFGLGFDGTRDSGAPAAKLLETMLGDWGSKSMSLLVMVSALGAVNGLIFTGSRIYASLGEDHRMFAVLGRWHPKIGVPVWSILSQAVVAIFLIIAVGTPTGRNIIDGMLQGIGIKTLSWDQYFGGFDTLVASTAPVFWTFFLLTGISLFVLRWKDRDIERPFQVPFYPVIPIIFCLTSVYMLYCSIIYAKTLSLLGIVPLLLGVPLYFISRQMTVSAN